MGSLGCRAGLELDHLTRARPFNELRTSTTSRGDGGKGVVRHAECLSGGAAGDCPRHEPRTADQVEALIQQNLFLNTENKVLRGRLPDRIIPTPEERKVLLKFGAPLGNAIKDLITIVTGRAGSQWRRGDARFPPENGRRPVRPPCRSRGTYDLSKRPGSKELLGERGIRRVVLVTEAVHMRRSASCFEKQGFEVIPAPCHFRSSLNSSTANRQ